MVIGSRCKRCIQIVSNIAGTAVGIVSNIFSTRCFTATIDNTFAHTTCCVSGLTSWTFVYDNKKLIVI